MRIQIASDLHLEFLYKTFPKATLITPAPDAELLVLAGDIGQSTEAIELFKRWPVPVLYVTGNHESHGQRWEENQAKILRASQGTQVTVLERDVAHVGNVRFLGCTLWTDYMLCGREHRPEAMEAARRDIRDHSVIMTDLGRAFMPMDALCDHETSRTWLEDQLAVAHAGPTVVITHYAPHPGSIPEAFRGKGLSNAAYTSDLTELVERADLWVHGHMHNSSRYTVGKCQVVCNPRGYPRNWKTAKHEAELVAQNDGFDPTFTIDV